jgi:UDP:flavonoid glycosyltransferase YjiC (YdhE family)
VRLPTYDFQDEELSGAIDRLLANEWLTSQLSRLSDRLRSNPGTIRAADLIERLARTGEPVGEG